MEEDAAVMDGEGGEWSPFAGGGVVVDVVRSDLLWLGEEERGRGNEIELVISIFIKGIVVISTV